MTNDYNNQFEDENFLFLPNKKNSFALPDGYFSSLSIRIQNRIEAMDELKEFKMLSNLSKEKVFETPQDYFKEKANSIESESELSEFKILNSITKPKLKKVENNYFDELEKNILLKKEIQEELNSYSTLHSIEKQNNFTLAPDYFDSVAEKVKEKIHNSNTTYVGLFEKLITYILKPKIAFASSFIILCAAISVWYFTTPNVLPDDGDCKTLACLEKRELLNEKNMNDFDVDKLYELVDVDALDSQLFQEDSVNVTNKNNN